MVSVVHVSSLLWGRTLTALGDISLAGVSMGNSQKEKRRRGGGEKGEEMKREAGGEVE